MKQYDTRYPLFTSLSTWNGSTAGPDAGSWAINSLVSHKLPVTWTNIISALAAKLESGARDRLELKPFSRKCFLKYAHSSSSLFLKLPFYFNLFVSHVVITFHIFNNIRILSYCCSKTRDSGFSLCFLSCWCLSSCLYEGKWVYPNVWVALKLFLQCGPLLFRLYIFFVIFEITL